MKNLLSWNPEVKLIFSDVDNTIAETYLPASSEMITALEGLLRKRIVLVMITGGSIESVYERIIQKINPTLREYIFVSTCSGAEVWGFENNGLLHRKPFYSLYNNRLSDKQKKIWRDCIAQVIKEFGFKTFPPMGNRDAFREKTNHDPLSIMYVDRGAQITFQLTNAYSLSLHEAKRLGVNPTHGVYDLRYPVMKRAEALFKKHHIPITARTGGTTAIDFAVEGVSKKTAVHWFLENDLLLKRFGLHSSILEKNPQMMEIWGDKFSRLNGGTDRHICEGLPKRVRAINFREENSDEFPYGYTIQIWKGKHHLQDGLLEYVQKSGI